MTVYSVHYYYDETVRLFSTFDKALAYLNAQNAEGFRYDCITEFVVDGGASRMIWYGGEFV